MVVSGATEPEWYYVIVLAGQSNAMAYGEGLPLPDSYDAPHPRIKQLARRNTVTPVVKYAYLTTSFLLTIVCMMFRI
ncbi:phage protein [Escherichia coli]|uniref:Phage protein n=1 Tax=Escherichia coli TaxID=562 RepID=A0A376UE63_ECOLX|nr:phage protein [Escherichia coli]